MIDRTAIRQHMDVVDSSGERIGKVDEVTGDRIKLTKDSAADGEHHHVALADVDRVDEHVHLNKSRADLLGTAGAGAGAGDAKSGSPIPPLRNPAVKDGDKRHNYMLPWVLGGLAILLLLLALTQCGKDHRIGGTDDTADLVNPRVAGAPLTQGTLAYDIDRFMGSKDGLPRTFTFDTVNFDSGTATLRQADEHDLDDIARVLAAYPTSRAAIVGYADAIGDSDFNRQLGADRAKTVLAALVARGVPADHLEVRSGGEQSPSASNVSPAGRFENRRTELVILKR